MKNMIDDFTINEWFNIYEGVLWFSIALIILLKKLRRIKGPEKIQYSSAFILFGISDIIEIYTGAWWRPWWLALIKCVSLAVIILFVYRLYIDHKLDRLKKKEA